jgi:hypothetical protein
MAFVKKNLVILASGLAALLFVVIGVLSMMSDRVRQDLASKAAIASQIQQLRSAPKNEATIQAEAERGRRFQDEFNDTLELAKSVNERKVLMEGVFPRPENLAIRADFKEAYRRAVLQLPRGKLMGDDVPNQVDVQEAAEELAEKAAMAEDESREGGKTAQAIKLPGPTAAGPFLIGPRPGSSTIAIAGVHTGVRPLGSGSSGAALGDPETDPQARAAVSRARSIRVYVSTDPARSSFHISPLWDTVDLPNADEMWYAQVSLWIQQDIIRAVAGLNDAAAQQLPEPARYVENMPVKRLQSVRVLGYLAESGSVPFPALAGARQGMELSPSFTGRKSNDQFDVVRFQVVAVVDQRQALALIDAITRQNFYKCVGLRQSAVTVQDPDLQEGYLYGQNPVVRAELDFEGYLARSVYEKLLPDEVRKALGIKGAK